MGRVGIRRDLRLEQAREPAKVVRSQVDVARIEGCANRGPFSELEVAIDGEALRLERLGINLGDEGRLREAR